MPLKDLNLRKEYNKRYYLKNKEKINKKHSDYMREYRKRNYVKKKEKERWDEYYSRPEKRKLKLDSHRKWRSENRERHREMVKKWNEDNIEHRKKYHHDYERSSEGKARMNKYFSTDKGKIARRLVCANRRARKKNVIETFSLQDWRQKLRDSKGICLMCNVWVGINKLSIDHIFPLSKASEEFRLSGVKRVYSIDDVQPLCMPCNRLKSDKLLGF